MPQQRSFDQLLLVTVLIMIGIGIVMIYNASATLAIRRYGQSPFHFLKCHLCHLVLALFILIGAMKSPYGIWKKWSSFLLAFSFVLLVLVLIPQIGSKLGGARRWIKIAPFLSFQPSELAKIAIIIFMASILAEKNDHLEEFRPVLPPLFIILALFFVIIVAQPDLGTGALIIFVALSMLYLAGLSYLYLILPVFFFLLCIGILIWIKPYRLDRIVAFFNPWYDPRGTGYQLIRSMVAVGSGGKMGLGLGNSIQSGISIPEPFTDFIFAIIAKEVGLIGACLVVTLFFLIIWRGLRIAHRCNNLFGRYLAAGLTCMIGYQGLINMGVVLGLLPTKGIPLPFISYGGSSLIFSALSIGILLNISQYA